MSIRAGQQPFSCPGRASDSGARSGTQGRRARLDVSNRSCRPGSRVSLRSRRHARSTRPGHGRSAAQRGLRTLPAGVAPSHPLDPGLAARGGRGVPDPVGGRPARQLDQSDADQLSVGGGANVHGDARGRQPGEAYLGHVQRDRGRLRRRNAARHGCAVLLWWSTFLYRVLDPFIVVLNAMPKIALVPIFYIWLGDVASIYAMAIAVSVFITILMLYTGFQAIDPDKIKLVRSVRGLALEGAHQDRAAGQRADHDLHAEGQCRPGAGRRGGRRVPGGQGRARLSSSSTAARFFR